MIYELGKHAPSGSPPFLPVQQAATWGTSDGIGIGVNNRALLFPFWVPTQFETSMIVFGINNSGNNVDVGIYDKNGNRVVSTGSVFFASSGRKEAAIPLTRLYPALNPYYWAISSSESSTDVMIYAIDYTASLENFRFDNAFPLPASLALGSPTLRGSEQPQFCIVRDGLTP